MTEGLPLSKENRVRIARAFGHVPRVDMSIDCVIEGQMGAAVADNAQSPTAFRLQLGSFTYFAGDATGPGGRELLQGLGPYTILMPSAPGWFEAARKLYTDRLVRIERYSYTDSQLSLDRLDELLASLDPGYAARRMDLSFAEKLSEQLHFVDFSEYESAADFVNRGIGYYMEADGDVIGVAYASLVCGRGIEVSVYIKEEHRRRGAATVLSAHLLKWCLENNTHANWDAANPASCRLAEKLGYVPVGSYEAYYIK